jgi:hypothetical protein
MSAEEALELIVDMIEKGGDPGTYRDLQSVVGDIETIAVSYELLDFAERRKLLEID